MFNALIFLCMRQGDGKAVGTLTKLRRYCAESLGICFSITAFPFAGVFFVAFFYYFRRNWLSDISFYKVLCSDLIDFDLVTNMVYHVWASHRNHKFNLHSILLIGAIFAEEEENKL